MAECYELWDISYPSSKALGTHQASMRVFQLSSGQDTPPGCVTECPAMRCTGPLTARTCGGGSLQADPTQDAIAKDPAQDAIARVCFVTRTRHGKINV